MGAIQVRRVRLGAAFVLLTYLILHFSNHALGLVSVDAMETGRRWFLAIWRSQLGTLALYGAIVVHGGLALWLLYQRRTLRMPAWEAAQYTLGLVLPALLASHVVGTRIAWWQAGSDDRYARLLFHFWGPAPGAGASRPLGGRGRRFRAPSPAAGAGPVRVGGGGLEGGRLAGILHAWVCGGRGRCSTCRVRVVRGLADLPLASLAEQRVLARVGAAPDVRLACQVRPVRDVAVLPLLAPSIAAADAFGSDVRQGREQEVAVLFADLRGFTRVAEHQLAHDVVFILNRYFEAVGGAIQEAGGIPNQFTGDGVMALFGVETGVELGCRQAVAAARAIVRHLAALNRELGEELQVPLRIGIGIHAGPAIVGRMGYGEGVYLTAVGDTVPVPGRPAPPPKGDGLRPVLSEQGAPPAALDVPAVSRPQPTVPHPRGLLAGGGD